MKTAARDRRRDHSASLLIAALLMALIVSIALTGVMAYVSQTSHLTQRKAELMAARQYAEGAAVIGARDLNTAVTHSGGTLWSRLTSISYAPYTLISGDGDGEGNGQNIYQRTLVKGAPFGNQPVVQIVITNASQPSAARIIATATVGQVTQTAILNVRISFGFGAAILSVNNGTSETAASKQVAQNGNVTINGAGRGPMVLYGGTNALAALANGRVNVSSTNTSVVDVPPESISMTNYLAGTPIPDYTTQGTSNTLFNIDRFIAVADATPNGYSPSGNNHFTNISTFITAVNLHPPSSPMQGVIVVDVDKNDNGMRNFNLKNIPAGINVKGSLIFNFLGSGWNPTTTKIVIDTPLNINAADISGLVATNPATYTTGYPPTYTDYTKNPVNVDISGQLDPATGARDFDNFTASDDLPALIYTIGVVDLHNSLNICGCMYTPSYMEVENKHSGDIQYIMGELIMGNGIYYEDTSAATSVIAYDRNAVKNLATSGTAAKEVFVEYWQ